MSNGGAAPDFIPQGIDQLIAESHSIARNNGFWDNEEFNVGEKLALIHSEVSEALECAREYPDALARQEYELDSRGQEKPIGFGSELADIMIRVADLAGKLDIPLGEITREKIEYNKKRPYKHSKAF